MANLDIDSISRHQQIIESLAEESNAPVEHVRALFEDHHSRLASEARVKAYVVVIATKLVRQTLSAERANQT